jgi:hypothetical protein
MFRSALVCLLSSFAAVHAGLVCDAPSHQAGPTRTGRPLTHEFVLRNDGRLPLDIVRVRAGCGCVAAVPAKKRLAPGETTTLRMTVNTVTQAAGANGWSSIVHYRQGEQEGELRLSMLATLQADVSISPAALVLHAGAGVGHSFTLTERRAEPMKLKLFSCSSPHIHVQDGPPRKDNGTWVRQIAVRVLPSMPEGRHEDALFILTTNADYPELRVPFTVVKQSAGTVQASPPSVDVFKGKDGAVPSRLVYLHARGDQPVRVQNVLAMHPALKATWANGPGERVTLRVVVDGDRVGPEGLSTEVVVEVVGPTRQSIRIPVEVRSPGR